MTKVYIVYEGESFTSMYHNDYETQEDMVKMFDCESKAIEYMCNKSHELIDEGLREHTFTRAITACRVREDTEVYYALWDTREGGKYLKYKSYDVE